MKNVVIIPAFNRPEFLFHCLHQIKKAAHAEQYYYLFAFDYGHHAHLYHITREFPFKHQIIQQKQTKYKLTKMSYNLLESYRIATAMTTGLIILIEDDVMIANDFFLYHERVHAKEPDIFSCHSTYNNNRGYYGMEGAGIEGYYHSTNDYNSLGVSFRAKVLTDYVLPYAVPEYYDHPMHFVTTVFPTSIVGERYCEQAGLIRRCQEEFYTATGMLGTVYPYIPRSFHAGFYGKNRGKPTRIVSLADRIANVGSIIFSDDAMHQAAERLEYYRDSMPINLVHPLEYEVKNVTLLNM